MSVLGGIDINNVGEGVIWTSAVVGGIAVMLRVAGTYILKPYARTRLAKQLAPLVDELATIRAEVTYNGGGSLKDAVRRTERRLDHMEGRMEEHDRWTRGQADGPDHMEPGL